jgi:hypothetical protein
MMVDNGKPLVANSARGLGARIGDVPPNDITIDEAGNVHPNAGGMSVAPSWRDLEVHRIPKRLKHIVPDARGSNADACWRLGTGSFDNSPVSALLAMRKENEVHGFVEPAHLMAANSYVAALTETRDQWAIDEE